MDGGGGGIKHLTDNRYYVIVKVTVTLTHQVTIEIPYYK